MNQPRINTRTSLVLLTLLFLVGCQSTVHLMPTPVGLLSGKHDPFANTPENEQSSEIGIGYATNRLPLGAKKSRFYTRDFDQDIRMGVAQVRIGAGGQSWEEIRQLSIKGIDKHESLLSLQHTEEQGVFKKEDSLATLPPELQDLFSRFNQAIEESPTKDITIYVHGANNNFYRTASQAAQYRHFTGRQAIVVLYSWPSAESIIRYGTDIRHIIKTVPTFVRFVKLLAEHTNARKINILAYSAGATLTTKSLAVLGRDSSQPDREAYRQSLRLGAIYFAAPDTDFDEFVEEYRSYQDIVDNVTMTMNRYDSVLGIAMTEHQSKNAPIIETEEHKSSKSRLGKPDLDDLTEQQAKWILKQTRTANFTVIDIDPKTIPGMAKGSHDYWYQSPWVSTDALLDLNFHALPEDRGLVSVETRKGARIWYFPADYETRVDAALDRLAEKIQQNTKNF
ncbi:MAG: alpha/beta hydrolase [Pseudomonadota bacterium]|nr:alpha/beta hydrolase [Pseudomonadota bacterium]